MKIFSAMVIGVAGGTISQCDAIEYDNKLWLVPNWLDIPAQGVTKPARIIRFDSLRHQKTPGPNGADFVINDPIPKELFDARTPRQAIPGFEFVEMPEISLPLKDKTKN
jgi:hypothetical protein